MVTEVAARRFLTAVVVLSVVVLAGTAALVMSPALRHAVGVGPGTAPPPYSPGDVVDVSPSVYQSSPRTLLLFARSDCAACQRSEGFHQAIVTAAEQAGTAVALMSPAADSSAELPYAGRLGLTRDQIHQIAPGSIRLRSVPTLMLVDADGRIEHVWFGVADTDAEAAILNTVVDANRTLRP